jgi:hypothetical protein
MCYLSKILTTSRFVPLFLAHGDVVVGFAIFHIAYSKKKKREKRKKKRHSSMVCECWWAPDESACHGLRKEKMWGGVPSFIKRAQKCQSLSQKLASFLYGR